MSVAEVTRPAVADEFDLADQYEIIDGVVVEGLPMSADSTSLITIFVQRMGPYGYANGYGQTYPEMLFKLPLPVDRSRRPDVSFVPFTRWRKNRGAPRTNAWAVLPSICVEIISPTDKADEILSKITEYFAAGVTLVWVVYPLHELLYVYESPTRVVGLTRADTLDGGTALPGFRLPLADLFPEPDTDPEPEPAVG